MSKDKDYLLTTEEVARLLFTTPLLVLEHLNEYKLEIAFVPSAPDEFYIWGSSVERVIESAVSIGSSDNHGEFIIPVVLRNNGYGFEGQGAGYVVTKTDVFNLMLSKLRERGDGNFSWEGRIKLNEKLNREEQFLTPSVNNLQSSE
jgi:hypothetical protein